MKSAIRSLGFLPLALLGGLTGPAALARGEDTQEFRRFDMKACASCHAGILQGWLQDQPAHVAGDELVPANPQDVSRLALERLAADDVALSDPLRVESILLAEVADNGLGAALEPADDALRAQLDLPKDQGVAVTSVAHGGPAETAGLRPNDILLSLGDKPLAKPEDVARALKDSGEKDVTLKLIRGGKPMTLQVKPRYNVSWGPVAAMRREYHIGVTVRPLDETLRGHLDLPAGHGLVVTSVVNDSPAATAGLKSNDILLAATPAGGKEALLSSPESLVAQVQASEGKPVEFKIVRGGKPTTVRVAPEHRSVPAEPMNPAAAHREWIRGRVLRHPDLSGFNPYLNAAPPGYRLRTPVAQPGLPPAGVNVAPPANAAERRLDAMDQELKELRKSIDELRKSLKRD